MLNGIYSSASAMHASTKQHEVIANNLANANVPGFKKAMLTTQTRGINQLDDVGAVQTQLRGNEFTKTHVDFSMGNLERTGRQLDFAINGDGFFEIETPEGKRYTRNGSFHLDPEGNLVTAMGDPVIGNGGPIQVPDDAPVAELNVTVDGTIWANGAEIGKLAVFDFQDRNALIQTAPTQFQAPAATNADPVDTEIVQATIERGNASIVHEMVGMIVGMRQFEAAQQSLKSIASVIQQHTTLES